MQQPSSFLFPYPAYATPAPASSSTNPMPPPPHHRPLSFADIMMLSPTAAAAQPKPNTAAKNKPKSNPTRNADPMLVDSRGSKPPRTRAQKPTPMMVITPVTSPAATTAASILLAGAKKDPASSSAIKAPASKPAIPPLHLHDDYTSNIMLVEDTFNIFVHILTDTGSPTPDPDAAARWTRPPSPPSSPMDQDPPVDPLANLFSDEDDDASA